MRSIREVIAEKVKTPALREYLLSCVSVSGVPEIDENPREIFIIPWVKTEKTSKGLFLRVRTEEGDLEFQSATVHIILRYTRKALFKKDASGKWVQARKFIRGSQHEHNGIEGTIEKDMFIGTVSDLLLYDTSGKVYLYEIRKVREYTVGEAIMKLMQAKAEGIRPIFVQFLLKPRLIKSQYEYIVPELDPKNTIGQLSEELLQDLELIKEHILWKKGSSPSSPFIVVEEYNKEDEGEDLDELTF
jgi:hypothetical protein